MKSVFMESPPWGLLWFLVLQECHLDNQPGLLRVGYAFSCPTEQRQLKHMAKNQENLWVISLY